MKGKGAIFLVDGMAMQAPRGGMPPEMQGAQPKIGQANDTGLNELLEKYGFKIGQDFVLDQPRVPGPDRAARRPQDAGERPGLRRRSRSPEDKDLSVLERIGALVFPFASSVELVGPLAGGKPQAGKLWTLAKTMPTAWKHTGMFFFSPTTKIEEGKEKGSYGLAYAYQGPLKSAFPLRRRAGRDVDADAPGAPPSESKKPVRLLVVGDSDFASRRIRAARPLPPDLPGRRADAVQRHRLDDRGRGADAGAHQDADRAPDPDRIARDGACAPGAEHRRRARWRSWCSASCAGGSAARAARA